MAILLEGSKVKNVSQTGCPYGRIQSKQGSKVCAIWDMITKKLSGLEGLRCPHSNEVAERDITFLTAKKEEHVGEETP